MSPQPLSGTGGPSRSRATVSSSRWNEAQTGVTCQSSGSLDALLPKPNLTTPGLVVLDAFTLRALAVAADSGLLTWPVSRYLADMQLCSIMHVFTRNQMGHTFVVRALFHVMFEAPWFWRNFLEKNRTQNKVTNCLAFFCILFIYCVYKVATARANPKGYQSFRPLCGVCSQMTKWFSILGVWMCLVLCRGTSVRSWNLLSDQLLPRSPRPE